MVYIFIILIMMGLISGFNILFNPLYEWYIYLIYTVALVIISVGIDGLVAFIIRAMPEKWFDYKKKIFVTSKGEMRIFKLIGVKKWKDKVPELGMFTNFRKNKIENPKDPAYLSRYILEACYGIVIHLVSFFTAFLILLCNLDLYKGVINLSLTVCLPVAIVNAVLIVLPAFILKHNLPKLVRLYEFNNLKK